MEPAALLFFVATYLLAVASPGPAVAAVVARALGRGAAGMAPFIAGLVVGDLVWFCVAALGLSVLAQTFHGVFVAVKFAGAAYLLWLAYKLWTAPAQAPSEPEQAAGEGLRLFLGGLALTLGNPKVMVFFLALLPQLVDLESLTLLGGVELAAAIVVVLGSVMAAYAIAAARARRLVRRPSVVRLVNRITGGAMAGAAISIAVR